MIKVPQLRSPEVQEKHSIKIRIGVIVANNQVTLQQNAQIRTKVLIGKPSAGKKFEDYTYAYGGAEEPQLANATPLPQAYENALAVMRQTLNNQDSLHILNM